MNKWSKQFWVDLAERVGSTFVGALLAAITLTGATSVDWSNGAAIWAVLGVPTVVSFLKGLLANLADPESGASLVPFPPGPEVNDDGQSNLLYVLCVIILLGIALWVFFGLLVPALR